MSAPTLFVLPIIFFFNDTATTEIYTLSLHDALPICGTCDPRWPSGRGASDRARCAPDPSGSGPGPRGGRTHRSEEHTSELQSQSNLVCRLLLEKKKKKYSMQDLYTSYRRYVGREPDC